MKRFGFSCFASRTDDRAVCGPQVFTRCSLLRCLFTCGQSASGHGKNTNSTRAPPMHNVHVDGLFSKAIIKADVPAITANDTRRQVAAMKVQDLTYWFTTDLRFAPNGNDFWLVVQYFGFPTRDAAGDAYGRYRQRFSKEDAESAKNRIVEYYSGSEDKGMFPFGRSDSLFLGAIFDKGWVLLNE
jgi:hypothetical protein